MIPGTTVCCNKQACLIGKLVFTLKGYDPQASVGAVIVESYGNYGSVLHVCVGLWNLSQAAQELHVIGWCRSCQLGKEV